MATTIDSTWLTNNGPAPFTLSTDNEVYTLATNVSVVPGSGGVSASFAGPVFKLTGKNVQLVLGQYRIYVNGKDYPQTLDNRLYRRTSEYARRIDTTKPVVTFGGTVADAKGTRPVVPDNATYTPLGVPYADSK